MGILKMFFGGESEGIREKTIAELTADFDGYGLSSQESTDGVVSLAKQIRELIAEKKVLLSRREKIQLIKAMNKAKVRALMNTNSEEGYEIFKSLDSISTDVSRLLY